MLTGFEGLLVDLRIPRRCPRSAGRSVTGLRPVAEDLDRERFAQSSPPRRLHHCCLCATASPMRATPGPGAPTRPARPCLPHRLRKVVDMEAKVGGGVNAANDGCDVVGLRGVVVNTQHHADLRSRLPTRRELGRGPRRVSGHAKRSSYPHKSSGPALTRTGLPAGNFLFACSGKK